MHILRVIRFSRHLKDLATTDVALTDAMDVIFDGDDDAASNALRSAPKVPQKANLQRARIRLDAVSMALEQREMAHYAETPSMVQSMHLFSDASPGTGTELQGMVIQICLSSGFMDTRVMPGVALWFGFTRLVDKAVALLWSLCLCCGPSPHVLDFVRMKVKSITTDMGTENGLNDIPNIIPAFLRWANGSPLDSLHGIVDRKSRMFPRSVRISGWGHMFGNLMKAAAQSVDQWPRMLSYTRILCTFWRNQTWRSAVAKHLADVMIALNCP